jgi:uncharacterized protein
MATVPCPTCQRPVEWSEAAPFRPFCSERCKLIDLGAWITEKHVIQGDEAPGLGGDDGDPDPPARH